MTGVGKLEAVSETGKEGIVVAYKRAGTSIISDVKRWVTSDVELRLLNGFSGVKL